MTAPRWTPIGEGLYIRDEDPSAAHPDADLVRVSQPGFTSDKDVAAALGEAMGGTWTRKGEWSAASGEPDVTAVWGRVDTIPAPPPTTPMLPPPEGPAIELPIPAGEAAYTMLAALANLTAAVVAVEKIGMALARQLDEGAP